MKPTKPRVPRAPDAVLAASFARLVECVERQQQHDHEMARRLLECVTTREGVDLARLELQCEQDRAAARPPRNFRVPDLNGTPPEPRPDLIAEREEP